MKVSNSVIENAGVQFAIDLFEELIEELRTGRLSAKDVEIKAHRRGVYEFIVRLPEETAVDNEMIN